MLNRTGGKLPGPSNIPTIQSVVREEAVQKAVFSSIQDHIFESSLATIMYSVSQSAFLNAS